MEDFEPRAAKVYWDAPGGWPKRKIDALRPSRRAQLEMYKSTFKKYPTEMQDAILAGRLPDRADEVAVKLAWGEPDYVWDYDRDCSALLYAVDRETPSLVASCGGEVDQVLPLLRGVTCEVLTATTARARADRKVFGRFTRDQQLDILAKHRASWMDASALKIAFGDRNPRDQGLGPILAPEGPQPNALATVAAAPAPVVVPAPAPVVPAPAPEPAAPAPATDEPDEPADTDAVATSESDPPAPTTPAPAPAPAPAPPPPAPVVATAPVGRMPVRYETRSVGSWSWESVCGDTAYTFEADVGDGYRVRATSRPDDGVIVQYVTQGDADVDDQDVRLYGFADGKLGEGALSLALGSWPVPSCKGVSVQASM